MLPIQLIKTEEVKMTDKNEMESYLVNCHGDGKFHEMEDLMEIDKLEEEIAELKQLNEECREVIKCIHTLWYANPSWLESEDSLMKMHHHLEYLFNYAGIESTLIINNTIEI